MLRKIRVQLDEEVELPLIDAVKGSFFDVVSGMVGFGCAVNAPFENVRIESDSLGKPGGSKVDVR